MPGRRVRGGLLRHVPLRIDLLLHQALSQSRPWAVRATRAQGRQTNSSHF
uniref:Uncharacterized protein n=1 Tax=Aegilops tauschii subsp. strangulata TaxID=200361 RepID=A0A453ALC0_AEGTS